MVSVLLQFHRRCSRGQQSYFGEVDFSFLFYDCFAEIELYIKRIGSHFESINNIQEF